MGTLLAAAVFALLGVVATGQFTGTVFPTYQHNKAYSSPVTTMSPVPTTTFSMDPQTSVSVHHTVVRNKPAYPFPYTDKNYQTQASEDTSYYYTYEDSSEEKSRMSSTPLTTFTTPTTKPTPRSFWNSQKAQLDARRKETSQKFLTTYNRPTVRSESKPKIEFKVREKPKFGLANKNKESTDSKKDNSVPTTTQKSVKFNNIEANSADEKVPEKEETKGSSKSSSLPLQNQIVGRLGDIPVQNTYSTQIQAPVQAQSSIVNNYGNSRQSKFDETIGNTQFGNNNGKLQQQSLRSSFNPQPSLGNIRNQQTPSTINTPEEFLLSLSKQQPLLNINQQGTNQNLLQNSNLQALLNAANNNQQLRSSNPQTLLNTNQLPLLNNQQPLISNPLPALANQQPLVQRNQLPLLSNNQQPSLGNLNGSPLRAFISTSPAVNTASRSADTYTNTNPSSTLLSRLGALGLNLASGGDSSRSGLVLARDGGYGGGQGLTFNLGPVADPLQILLKLLSLIPRPLLDLNGRLFFGIELGKNAGLVSGAGPVHKPVVG